MKKERRLHTKILKSSAITSVILISSLLIISYDFFKKNISDENSNIHDRNEWFIQMRLNHLDTSNVSGFEDGYFKASKLREKLVTEESNKSTNELPYKDGWECIGPFDIGGRVTDVEMPINSDSIIYVGAAAGGVFKTVNLGDTWYPIFDSVSSSLSIGDIAIDNRYPDTLYVATGEVNGGNGALTFPGDGIYRSTNAGKSWNKFGKGLEGSKYISKIVIDPNDSSVVYAGVMGSLFSPSSDRGIYKYYEKTDEWVKIFPDTNNRRNARITEPHLTGCIDLEIHPDSSHILYAAMWQRIRDESEIEYGGKSSGIFKSIDSGKTWHKLEIESPSQENFIGRISIAISKSKPNLLYALILYPNGTLKGVYRTDRAGVSWEEIDTDFEGFPSNYVENAGWWNCGIEIYDESIRND